LKINHTAKKTTNTPAKTPIAIPAFAAPLESAVLSTGAVGVAEAVALVDVELSVDEVGATASVKSRDDSVVGTIAVGREDEALVLVRALRVVLVSAVDVAWTGAPFALVAVSSFSVVVAGAGDRVTDSQNSASVMVICLLVSAAGVCACCSKIKSVKELKRLSQNSCPWRL